jgi:cobalt-zinc-cadmium efflux system protein
MGAGHSHDHAAGANERALWIALGLTTTFLIAELVGGILTNSLALISDAAHMFTDTAALAISLVAIRIGRRPADARRTFGYFRFEILAAMVNAMLLFLVALYILYEAYQRLQSPPEIESMGMLIIAIIGLMVNLLSMRILSGGKEHSLNVKGAYLEVWSDMLGSVGVILGALLIRITGWSWIDSGVAIAIGLWVLPRTWTLLKASMHILLEGVPEGIGLEEVEHAITSIPGVASVHDLHVWAISSGKISLTVHAVCTGEPTDYSHTLKAIRSMLAERFDIHHATVQLEDNPCEQATDLHTFGPAISFDHADKHSSHAHD